MQEEELELQEHDFYEILPELTPQERIQLEKEHRDRLLNFYAKNKKYEIDYWYPAISQFTYASFSFPLTCAEAYLLHCLYYEDQINPQMQEVQARLMGKIDGLLNCNRSQNNEGVFFMKLSTRSPKDYCWDYRDPVHFQQAVQKLIVYLRQNNVNQSTPGDSLNNLLYNFFLENSQERLAVRSGADFVRIFSKSERIVTDINDFSYLNDSVFELIKQGQATPDQKQRTLIQVWVRDWDNCQWSEEFRAFFYDYKLTAISQYDQRCYFEGLAAKKQEIAKACLEYFSQLKPCLQKIDLPQGVIDFIVKPDSIKVVQINVFDRDARASLFSWDQDQQLLMHGPLEVRVLDKEIEISRAQLGSIMGMIDKKSLEVIASALQQTGLAALWK